MYERLGNFTAAYHAEVEAELKRFGRSRLPYHGAAVTIIHICKASDGYVTFYLPEQPGIPAGIPRGCIGVDYSAYDLNTLCQAMHNGLLRVGEPNLGHPAADLPPIPPDVERPGDITGTWFSSEARAAARDGLLSGFPLPAVMVVPVVQVQNGIRTAVLPSRIKVWSPTVHIPGKGIVRLYDWTHADFWWKAEELPLETERAHGLAVADVLSLQIVLESEGVITTATAGQNTPSHAADILDASCDEFLQLLEIGGDDEERIHQWLYLPQHHLFIDSQPHEVRSKVPFGSKVSDFVVRRPNNTYVLVEIERATCKVFQTRGQEPTAEFNHACQQIRDWQRYVRDNVHTVRNELTLEGIDQPLGALVIGRTRDIAGAEAQLRWRDMKSGNGVNVATYDDVCDRVRSLANSLRCVLQSSAEGGTPAKASA